MNPSTEFRRRLKDAWARRRSSGGDDLKKLAARFDAGTLASLSESEPKTTKLQLAERLDASLEISGNQIRSAPRKHAFDLIVATVALAFVGLYVNWLRTPPVKKAPRVIAARAIPAYTTLDLEDLKIADEPDPAKWPAMRDPFLGKMALTSIGRGAAVAPGQLTAAPLRLAGQSVVKLSIKAVPALAGRPLPQAIQALFSPRNNPDAGAVITAVLLALDSSASPPVATIAVTASDLPQVARWIGSSDVYLILRVP